MMNPKILSLAAALAAAGFTAAQQPAPTLPYVRTLDVLLIDNGDENVWRLSDFNQDGDYYDAGEQLLYYDDLAFGDVLQTPTGIACSPTGTAYVCDSNRDIVLSLRDLNLDGDALDAGEANVFFDSATNASGIEMISANSIVVDQLGRIYVLSANSGTTLLGDVIIELQDLNADGDANDLGEAKYYCDIPGSGGSIGASVPTRFALGPDGAFYYGDIGTVVTKGVYRAFDADNSGFVDPTEVSLWWVPPSFATSPAWYGFAFDLAGQLYVANHGGGSTANKSVHRAFDFNASGAIDPGLPEETLTYTWTSGSATFWDLLRRDDDSLLLLDGIGDAIYQLKDLNSDGDFEDSGEFTPVFDDTTVGLVLDPRAMAMLRAPELVMSPATIALGGTTNFEVRAAKPFDICLSVASLSLIPPVSLPPWGNLEIDPFTVIPFGSGLADAQGLFVSPLAFNNDPALIGSYGCAALCGDFYRLYLTNGAPLTVTPAPALPTLVINEVDYDQVGTDGAEYIEILNVGANPVSLAGIEVRLINGATSAEYDAYPLSLAGPTLAPGQFLVIASPGVTVAPGALTIPTNFATNVVQNGAPDGIALFDLNSNQMVDALSYEGAINAAVLTGVPGTWDLVEGTAFAGADSNAVDATLVRLPNGTDTNDASVDWAVSSVLTPGASNL